MTDKVSIGELKNIILDHISDPEDWIAEWDRLVNLLSSMSLKREERMEPDLQEATYSEEGFCERNKSILPPVEELLLSRK